MLLDRAVHTAWAIVQGDSVIGGIKIRINPPTPLPIWAIVSRVATVTLDTFASALMLYVLGLFCAMALSYTRSLIFGSHDQNYTNASKILA